MDTTFREKSSKLFNLFSLCSEGGGGERTDAGRARGRRRGRVVARRARSLFVHSGVQQGHTRVDPAYTVVTLNSRESDSQAVTRLHGVVGGGGERADARRARGRRRGRVVARTPFWPICRVCPPEKQKDGGEECFGGRGVRSILVACPPVGPLCWVRLPFPD